MKKLNKKGFTIVELVIVIAVIGILAAVLIPTFSGVVSKANASAALQTAKSTLSNALTMSSTAQLAGQTVDKGYRTMIVVDGYAFGYTGNQLVAIDYPKEDTKFIHNTTSTGKNAFNAIMIAAENLVENETDDEPKTYTIKNVDDEIKAYSETNKTGCTDINEINNVTYVLDANNVGHYYLNYVAATTGESPTTASWDAEIFINSDFSNKVVVFTTFG